VAKHAHKGLRIIGGRFRGRKLLVPEGNAVRPTSDRAREALFNILEHGDYRTDAGPLPLGARVLDVFAGAGALGIEALSRGASHVAFLEQEPAHLKLIRKNAFQLGETGSVSMLQRDGAAPGPPPAGGQVPADLVLLDPPYNSGLGVTALAGLAENGWLAANCVAVIEAAAKEAVDTAAGFSVTDERTYGAAKLVFLKRDDSG